ncbi:hypothetical protein BJY04DRAFT_233138 [Aspergillus karnatakaensis]|uniref:uncharacterized protein n=1 Tax=Aspergillus karnatakaensis TaxID=1810916 RepID=UPI003CCD9B0D
MALLLTPYDDRMRLGQGYNSFLQELRVDNAVTFDKEIMCPVAASQSTSATQNISYSTKVVEKASHITEPMRISAASCIKQGTVMLPGGGLSLDTATFPSSDLQALVSVKVVNRNNDSMYTVREIDSNEFHEIYGDSFISGFIEGGELHAVISARVLEESNKDTLVSALEKALNNCTEGKESTNSNPDSKNDLESAFSTHKHSISVNWVGGGQIRREDADWDLPSLFKVVSEYPDLVKKIPARTYAILTKYDECPSFISWARTREITIPQYETANARAKEAFNAYMAYKRHLKLVQDALAQPEKYKQNEAAGAVEMGVRALIIARKAIRTEMAAIVEEVDKLDRMPESAREIKASTGLTGPEMWAARLPICFDSPLLALPATTNLAPGQGIQ